MWNKIKTGLQRFMDGRYGVDDLNRVILFAAMAFCILNIFFKQMWLTIICWVLLALWIFRSFSKNTEARWKENENFTGFFRYLKAVITQSGSYKIFRCRKCRRMIRVPRRHGRVEVTCPECGERRIVETGKKA